jgi:hypothetical protein
MPADDPADIMARAMTYGAEEAIPIFSQEAIAIAKDFGLKMEVVTGEQMQAILAEAMSPPNTVLGVMYRLQIESAKRTVEIGDAALMAEAATATAH